jgi:hypothetical protein
MSNRVIRFNTDIDEEYGRGEHPRTTSSASSPSEASTSSPKSAGCPVFGHHPANAHREEEIVGGAFGHH